MRWGGGPCTMGWPRSSWVDAASTMLLVAPLATANVGRAHSPGAARASNSPHNCPRNCTVQRCHQRGRINRAAMSALPLHHHGQARHHPRHLGATLGNALVQQAQGVHKVTHLRPQGNHALGDFIAHQHHRAGGRFQRF